MAPWSQEAQYTVGGDKCLITIQYVESLPIGVHRRPGELTRWPSRLRRQNRQGSLPE